MWVSSMSHSLSLDCSSFINVMNVPRVAMSSMRLRHFPSCEFKHLTFLTRLSNGLVTAQLLCYTGVVTLLVTS